MAGTPEELMLEHAAAASFQLVWGWASGLKKRIGDKNDVQRGMREYARRFLERYGNIKVLNMAQPVPLREVYVAAQVHSPRLVQGFRSVNELHEMFSQRGKHHLFSREEGEERRDCLELANEEQYLNVLGAPGAGKSTLLRRLGLEALLPRRAWDDTILQPLGLRASLRDKERSQYGHDCLPVMLELRRFRVEEIDLLNLIQEELATCGLPESGTLARALLEGGRLLLLLDGVDEVPGDQLDTALAHIRDFVDRYSGNRFVTSCRTAFYKGFFSRFRDVLLADFDEGQIANFVRNWFRSEHDRQQGIAEEFLKVLDAPAHAPAKELASTPLLLTFLCLTYDDRRRLLTNRSELYRQALEILMERWAASKRVHDEPVYRELSGRLEVQMLADIAAPAFADNRYFFTRRELTEHITRFLRDELNAPKHLNGDQVLEAIEVHQGLIVQRAQDAWSFSHLTLQEYLTAVWYENNPRLEQLVHEHLFDVRWREVFILVAGGVSKADDLLERIQREAERPLTGSPRTLQLLRWAQGMVAAPPDAEKASALRAIALSFSLLFARALDDARARGLARVLSRAIDHALDLALSLGLARALGLGGHLNQARGLARARALGLNPARDRDRTSYLYELIVILERASAFLPFSEALRETLRQAQAAISSVDGKSSHQEMNEVWEQALDGIAATLQLPPGTDELREEEAIALRNYLYACGLIVSCKDAATRVSRLAWESLCQRMLSPPEKPPSNRTRRGHRRK
jgi:hypothetical protein